MLPVLIDSVMVQSVQTFLSDNQLLTVNLPPLLLSFPVCMFVITIAKGWGTAGPLARRSSSPVHCTFTDCRHKANCIVWTNPSAWHWLSQQRCCWYLFPHWCSAHTGRNRRRYPEYGWHWNVTHALRTRQYRLSWRIWVLASAGESEDRYRMT